MTIFVECGDTVEGHHCETYTRKEIFKGLRADPITQKPMVVYELSKNCSVEVTHALIFGDDDSIIRNEKNIHCKIGDKIKGESITLYVDTKRKLRIEVKEGLTGTHGGHLISTTKRTIGIVKYPFDNLLKLLGHTANSTSKQIIEK